MLNQATEDWHTNAVTLSATKGLGMRFFAPLRMTRPSGRRAKCTNVVWFDLEQQGVRNVADLVGGIAAWEAARLSIAGSAAQAQAAVAV